MSQANKKTECVFQLKVAASADARKGQLLAAWMYLAETFEAFQNTGIQASPAANKIYGIYKGQIDKQPSGFSTEDLVSDLVAFYSVVESTAEKEITWKDLVNKYAGRMNEKDEETAISMMIWKYSLKCEPGYKKWTPKYFDHEKFLAMDADKVSSDYIREQKGYAVGTKPEHRQAYYRLVEKDAAVLNKKLRGIQKTVKHYATTFGTPTFPEFFQKYKSTTEGYTFMYCYNNGKLVPGGFPEYE